MKTKYLSLIFSIFITSFYSCNKSNDLNTASIIGKWILTKYEVKTYLNGNLSDDTSYSEKDNYLQLNSDNTGYISENPGIDPITGNITYTKSGTDLTIMLSNNYTINYTVNSLSSSALALQSKSGIINNTQSIIIYYYTK